MSTGAGSVDVHRNTSVAFQYGAEDFEACARLHAERSTPSLVGLPALGVSHHDVFQASGASLTVDEHRNISIVFQQSAEDLDACAPLHDEGRTTGLVALFALRS